jgi:citronellyl-CoA synthetase
MAQKVVSIMLDTGGPILDDNGFMQKVGPGEVGLLLGEISVGTPFKGYTDEAETNKKILNNVLVPDDRYFNTGDLVRDIGYKHVQFVDSLGDTFRWKGENVSTTEVEAIINQVEGIEGSAVYGVSIPGTDGRAGMATIITNDTSGGIDQKELGQYLKSALPSYAVPIFIRIKSHFDTTATYKIRKVDLSKEAFDLDKVSDLLYIMLSHETEYQLLTADIYQQVMEKQFRF